MEALRIPVALDAVVVRVGALAPGAVTPAAKRCVVSPGQTLKTEALFALKSSVGTFTAACHNNSFWSRAENRNSPRSGASQARLTRAKRRPLRIQRLIYISILESFVKRFYGNRSKMYY